MAKPFFFYPDHKRFPKNRTTLVENQRKQMLRTPLMIFGLSVAFVVVTIVILAVQDKLNGAGGLPFLGVFIIVGGLVGAYIAYRASKKFLDLYESGKLLDGEITNVKAANARSVYDITCKFTSPTGKALTGSGQWKNDVQKPPTTGTPVKILYKSDRHFTIL